MNTFAIAVKTNNSSTENKHSCLRKPSKTIYDTNYELDCSPTLSSESGDNTRTELSDMFDPAALPISGSTDHHSLSTKSSTEVDESEKKSTNTSSKSNSFRIKFKSPIKVLSRKKKKDSQSEEDMDIFEEKGPVDLLDVGIGDSMDENAEEVLPFTTTNNLITASPVTKNAPILNYPKSGNVVTLSPLQTLSVKPLGRSGIPKPNPLKSHARASSFDKMLQLFTGPKEKESEVDLSIGLRLALPDKLDIMTGSTPIKEDDKRETPSKKLMMVAPRANLRFSKSPFKRRPLAKPLISDSVKLEDQGKEDLCTTVNSSSSDEEMRDIILRTSELEPSVHQISIPDIADLLIHGKICALMEGYDKLLETRAKAGKRWFSFGHLVGLPRKDLENMYLSATGKTPAIPMYIGKEAENLPPPLPNIVNNSFDPPSLGNPFETLGNDRHSLKSFQSIHSDDSSGIISNSKYPRKRSSVPKGMKPHPSTIKSLLECCDDITVEGYFNETIGNDNVLTEDVESTSVQVAIFSSQRCRQFIICYRGSIGLHSKPIRKNTPCNLDANGLNDVFGNSYLPELEKKVFELVERLSTENPFCDFVFTGHSFGGCLSLITAVRCAEIYQDMTVSFHGFGIPKVGQEDFRLRAHSLPNLKIFRVENCSDLYVHLPADPWAQVGHTIAIKYSKNNKKNDVQHSQGNGNGCEIISVDAKAYKFGKRDQIVAKTAIHRVRKTIDARTKKAQAKADHEMGNYLHSLEQFNHMGSPWVSSFANELGTGIVTKENEIRMVV